MESGPPAFGKRIFARVPEKLGNFVLSEPQIPRNQVAAPPHFCLDEPPQNAPWRDTVARARGRVTLGRRAFSCNAPALARVLGPRANLPLTTIAAASFGGSPLARRSGPLTGCRSARGAESSRRWWRRDCLKLESKAGVYI